jgi:hypothetical protein
MGGFDANYLPIDHMEVFDSKTKVIKKVLDDQNNWIKVPFSITGTSTSTCAVSLVEKNAFVILGGLLSRFLNLVFILTSHSWIDFKKLAVLYWSKLKWALLATIYIYYFLISGTLWTYQIAH